MKLENKSAVITGGGSGIGFGIACAFAAEGCRVVIAGRREQQLRDAAESWHDATPIRYHRVNVAHRGSVQRLFTWAEEQLGDIDILVNAAGMNIKNRSMAEMEPEDWDRLLTVNATGAYNCMYAVLPGMRRRRDGVIINISSVAGKRAAALGGIAYDASKFAMTGLGTAVGNEVAPDGVRITNIYPGEVDTPILEQRPTPVTDEHRQSMLKPDDVAALVLTIASLPARAHVPEAVIKPLYQEYC